MSEVNAHGWVSVAVDEQHEEAARRIRAERDKQYGNLYSEESSDKRWVGDLGELAFKSWLKARGLAGVEWIRDNAAGKPDFILPPTVRVGVKTVKRKGPPEPGYTAQITAKHAMEPADHFFFLSYEIERKTMWLLGGITHGIFLQDARHYGAGEWVHPGYQIREGHEIYNVEITKLLPPDRWLSTVREAK